jgi:hypothetical protein
MTALMRQSAMHDATTLAAAVQLLAARAADQGRDTHALRRTGKAA